ncbi:MAG: chorismate mutase [Pseudomonadota bacterium]
MSIRLRMKKPKLKSAAECETMQDVRYEVDRIDELLVDLLAERQSMMDAAARIKQHRNTVRDEARIEDVVAKVLRHANQVGLSPNIAEPVWRLLIEKCIEYEFVRFDENSCD